MRVHELLGDHGPLDAGAAEMRGQDVEIRSVVSDSRRVEPGALFACIPGARADGHDHAPEATARGASALLVEHFLDLPAPQVRVDSVRSALGPVAAMVAGSPSRAMRVVGVTGTNGKTTTTLLLEQVFTAAGLRAGVLGTLGTRVDGREQPGDRTTPEADVLQSTLAAMRDAGVEAVAMEVSSHALAQHRVDGTCFAAAVFTNLSHEHLDFHRSLDEYFAAKATLFRPERTRVAIVNRDDDFGRRLATQAREQGLRVVTYSERGEADVRAEVVVPGRESTQLTVVAFGRLRFDVSLRLPGAVNRLNALAAAATALAPGLELGVEAVADGLSRRIVVPGRFERITTDEPFDVFVDYAHTPDALRAVLEAARERARGRVTVVFGCGGDRDPSKRAAMGRVAADGADTVIVTSDNPRSEDPEAIAAPVAEGVRERGGRVDVELDRRTAIERAVSSARPGGVVVVAGKGHETGQEIGGRVVPFDDRAVVRAVLGGPG